MEASLKQELHDELKNARYNRHLRRFFVSKVSRKLRKGSKEDPWDILTEAVMAFENQRRMKMGLPV